MNCTELTEDKNEGSWTKSVGVWKRCVLSKQWHSVGLITCDNLLISDFMTFILFLLRAKKESCQYNLTAKSQYGHIKLH